MNDQTKTVSLTIEFTEADAWHLAQFLKRTGFSDFRNQARDDDEAYAMRDAAASVRDALEKAGYAPR